MEGRDILRIEKQWEDTDVAMAATARMMSEPLDFGSDESSRQPRDQLASSGEEAFPQIVHPSKEGESSEYEIDTLNHSSDVGNLLVSPEFKNFQLTPHEQDELNAFVFDLIGPSSLPADPLVSLIPGPVAISTASVLVSVDTSVVVSVSGSQSRPEYEKITALHGLDGPSVSLEGDFMTAEAREQEVQIEQPCKSKQ